MLYKYLMLHIYTIPTMKFEDVWELIHYFKVVQSFITVKDSLYYV